MLAGPSPETRPHACADELGSGGVAMSRVARLDFSDVFSNCEQASSVLIRRTFRFGAVALARALQCCDDEISFAILFRVERGEHVNIEGRLCLINFDEGGSQFSCLRSVANGSFHLEAEDLGTGGCSITSNVGHPQGSLPPKPTIGARVVVRVVVAF